MSHAAHAVHSGACRGIPSPLVPARGARRGFTLLETIFSAAFVAFVVLLLFNIYPTSWLSVRRCEHRMQAAMLARSILERMRARPFRELASLPLDQPRPDASRTLDDGVVLNSRVSLHAVPGTDSTRLRRVEVVIWWDEKARLQKSLSQELLICDIKR